MAIIEKQHHFLFYHQDTPQPELDSTLDAFDGVDLTDLTEWIDDIDESDLVQNAEVIEKDLGMTGDEDPLASQALVASMTRDILPDSQIEEVCVAHSIYSFILTKMIFFSEFSSTIPEDKF